MRISRPSQFFKALGFTAALPISASLLMISMGKAQASGQFSKTCNYITLESKDFSKRAILTADCRRRDGSTNSGASINLNDYIVNDNSYLRWASHGDFQESCEAAYLIDQHTMEAICRARNGDYYYDDIDLDDHIANINGNLVHN